jgi:PKD repeat protein
MKRIILLTLFTVVMFFFFSCRKGEYFSPTISESKTDTIVLNIGDKTILAPNINSLLGNTYKWLVNGTQVSTGNINYTFQATEPGDFDVTLKVTNWGGTDEFAYKIFVEKPIAVSLGSLSSIAMCEVLEVNPTVTGPDRTDYEYRWSIGDSVIAKKRTLSFISFLPGNYSVSLRVTAGKQSTTATGTIAVTQAQYVRNAYTLLEYLPSPARNHNWSIIGAAQNWDFGSEFPLSYNAFLSKASELRKQSVGNGLLLGSWGGSATFKFDHTVVNVPGKADIELTAIVSNLDPPAVYVAYDKNKNGKPDADEWYEIKNKDYGLEDLPDYTMTFTYDSTQVDTRRIYTYYSWKDNQVEPVKGQIMNQKTFTASLTYTGAFSVRGFFPGYNMIDVATKQVGLLEGWSNSFTRKGKRITRDLSSAGQFSQKLNIDLDLAVNSKGESILLPGIDFIKVQKVVYPLARDIFNPSAGVLDANMNEDRMLTVSGILDMHLKN